VNPRRNIVRTVAGLTPLLMWLLLAAPAPAATRMEGYYSVYQNMEKLDRNWHAYTPSHYAELKFISDHGQGLESYLKLRSNVNGDDDRTVEAEYYTPPWVGAEGHVKIHGDKQELILFSRQNHFWINDEPLFNLVNDGKVKNDNWGPQSQGVRIEAWDHRLPLEWLGTWGATLIYSDNGGTYDDASGVKADGEDALIARVRNRAYGDRIVGGLMALQKDWSNSNRDDEALTRLSHNTVYAVDMAFFPRDLVETGLHLGPIDLEQSRWTVEYAWSSTPDREDGHPEYEDAASIFGAEFRDVHLSNLILHGWYFNAGENFRNYLSSRFDDGREFNRKTKHVEGIWFVPRKAITAKVAYDKLEKRIEDEVGGGLRPQTSWYGEVYVEFINGFKGKVAHRRWRGFDASSEVNDFFTYPDWFAEVSVENFLAKIRLQGRIRDIGTFREVTAFGFDMNVNITERLKGYLRMLNVNEEIEARHTMFAQLKYELGFGANLFFEYGDAGQSDNIVYTDWFVNDGNNDNLKDRVALSFQTWF